MLTSVKKYCLSLITAIAAGVLSVKHSLIHAAIENPAIAPELGTYSEEIKDGSKLTEYFVNLWSIVINLGGLAVILYFIWGAINWITSSGDSGKLKEARQKMLHAFIGMMILAFSFLIISVIDGLFFGDAFSILDISFDSPL